MEFVVTYNGCGQEGKQNCLPLEFTVDSVSNTNTAV